MFEILKILRFLELNILKILRFLKKSKQLRFWKFWGKISGNVDSQMHENEFCDSSEIIANKTWHFTTGS